MTTTTAVATPDPDEPRRQNAPVREKLPRSRTSLTWEFRVADTKCHVTVGEYDDGRPGEIFIRINKQGSTLAGVLDAFGIAVSTGLQYGIPLRVSVEQFTNARFEPAGMTDDLELRIASSILDYVFRRLAVEYMTLEDRTELNILKTSERSDPGARLFQPDQPPPIDPPAPVTEGPGPIPYVSTDAPYCMQCGIQMMRAGSCYVCPSCGSTSGCN